MIDSHHHLWRYRPGDFPWIGDGMDVLKRDYLPADLVAAATGCDVGGFVSVQARQSLEETDFLLAAARAEPLVKGVVGWVPLCTPVAAAAALDRLEAEPLLKGVRHIVHDEPDDRFILGDEFNEGVGLLAGRGLVYDILIFPRHLPQAVAFVDRHPGQRFVVDHVGKPAVRAAAFDRTWASQLRCLAERENVTCKLSGIVTEVRDDAWGPELLRPYVETALDAFGPGRLMFGSDWPVCLLRSTYQAWARAALTLLQGLSAAERDEVLAGTATRVYDLGA